MSECNGSDEAERDNQCSDFSCSSGDSEAEESATCECAIETLLQRPFTSFSSTEKSNIIENDRPKQPLSGLSMKSKGRKVFTRRFNVNSYETVPWLCGCSKLKKLFCWPCLLFSLEKNAWNTTGFDDLNNLHKSQRRHKLSYHHITSLKQLKSFSNTRNEFSLSQSFQFSIDAYNETVKKNRRILSHMIKAVCFLGKQGLAFRGHNESQKSLNRGNYVELLNELAESDMELEYHLKHSNVFSGLSSDVQNDLISSISELMIMKIKEEVKMTPFVSIILDETRDTANKSQLSVTLRYTTAGSVQERFLGFKDISNNQTANTLAQYVFAVLHNFECEKKLIAQTYDGAAVMSGEHNRLQAKVKEKCAKAIFVHCYSHKLNVVLSQSLAFIKECKIFFANLSCFGAFFSRSIERVAALDAEVNKRFPSTAPTRWNYNSRLVETVNSHHNDLVNLMTSIIDNADKWDGETVCSAHGLLSILQDFDFNFFLTLFSLIFPETNIILNAMQEKIFDIDFCKKKIEKFLSHLSTLQEDFDFVWNKCKHWGRNEEPPRKRIQFSVPVEDREYSFRMLFCEIIYVIRSNIEYRFKELPTLKFMILLDSRKFQKFQKHFPDLEFSCLKESYGNCFDFESLKSELAVVFRDREMHKENISKFCEYLINLDLVDVFPEVYKLAQLIITIPASSSSAERSFSALKRMKTYLRNTQGQERMSTLALISIEKALLTELRHGSKFNDDVIDIFAQKNRNIELIYKK